MPITTVTNANDILNRVAAETGTQPVTDPYSSSDPTFVQMRYLLDTAGEDLAIAYPWELLIKEAVIKTMSGDSGNYQLPEDFYYMIDQTGWERSQHVPLSGPLSAQDWQCLLGRDLATSTIYASFRLNEGMFKIFPQPPPENLDIHYEYVNKNWVYDVENDVYTDKVVKGTSKPQYDKTLITRALKVKFLEAKGFDSSKAQADFNQTFSFLTGLDKGAQILNAGGRRGFPYLDMYRNVADSNYGY